MKSNKIHITDEFLFSDRRFLDALIGNILSSAKFFSLKKAAREIGCTPRRISQAVERLQKSGHLVKIKNLIILDDKDYNSIKQIQKFRIELLSYHGIRTPQAIKFRGRYRAALYAPNSYIFSIDSHGLKGPSLNLTLKSKTGRIVPLCKTSKYILWQFNNNTYNLQEYLSDHGFKYI